jgi:hypothetical protein
MTPEAVWRENEKNVERAIRDTPPNDIHELSDRERLIARIAFKCGVLAGQREKAK